MNVSTGQNLIISLQNLGWSVNAIVHQAQVNSVTVLNIKKGKSERITTRVAERLQELFENATGKEISVLEAGPIERKREMPAPPAKKKPGRKPQPKTDVENADQAPKKRGRPKKDVSDAPKVLKKRGRPAREAVEADVVAERPKTQAQAPQSAPSDYAKMIKADGSLDLQMLDAEISRLKERLIDLESVRGAYLSLIKRIEGQVPF
jgi:hypothetical protein